MFGSNSRYKNIPIVESESKNGEKVNVVKLRRLPYVAGNITQLKATDSLDIMSHRKYKDATMFWHIADSNTELEANDIVEQEKSENPLAKESVKYILVPEN